jgi:DNA (cytosine-5)-methyltransferase 1
MGQRLKIIDLFCGTGGFSAGFETTGEFEVKAGIDLLEDRLRTFKANHKHAYVIEGDIKQWSPIKFCKTTGLVPGDVDVVIGGPPCQGFSSVRPFRSLNLEDPRNTLFESFALFVQFYRPTFFVMENVVGLISHNKGKTIQRIVEAFEAIGYCTDWRVLNAVHYGLPQRRERVVVIGHFGNKKSVIFPEPTHYFEGRSMAPINHNKVVRTYPLMQYILAPAVTVMEAIHDLPELRAGDKKTQYRSDISPSSYEVERRKNTEQLTLHEATAHTEKMLKVIKCAGANIFSLPPGMVTSGFSTSYSRIEPDQPSVTLTVNFVHPGSNKCIHPYQDRALTPREGARLQGFDDDYIFVGNRSQIVKQIGNAVPPLLGRAIASALLPQW